MKLADSGVVCAKSFEGFVAADAVTLSVFFPCILGLTDLFQHFGDIMGAVLADFCWMF